jgi:hypothetical protein
MSVSHDIHLSKTDIIYNQQTESIEITLHIFIDDLESVLAMQGHSGLKICTPKESENAESLIAAYLKKNLKISTGGSDLEWNFLGKEISEDLFAVWCYMEIEKPELAKELIVEVNLLNELYDDQKNIVKIEYDKNHKDFFLFDKKKFKGTLSL